MGNVADLSEAARQFVESTIAEMEEIGVSVTLSDAEYLDWGGRIGGYFDEDEPAFAVATGTPTTQLWLSVFVHEYCHFRQWRQETAAWTAKLPGDSCPQHVFDAWLAGVVELTPQQRDDAIRLIVACERECEVLSLELLDKTPTLLLDRQWYVRAANTYLAWYGVVRMTRRWYDRSPYSDHAIVDLMPGDRLITVDEALRPPPGIVAAVLGKVFTDTP